LWYNYVGDNMSYKTIKNDIETTIIINKSKFISHLRRCSSEEEAKLILEEIREIYDDANHNCYAYVIGKDKILKKCSDDGEPSQTAGVPILNVLEHNDVTDVICIVTRYFGGIKLGAGGLVRAYSKGCSSVIEECVFVNKEPGLLVEIVVNYKQGQKLDYYLEENNIEVINKDYYDKVIFNVKINKDSYLNLNTYLTNLTSNTHIVEIKDEIYIIN